MESPRLDTTKVVPVSEIRPGMYVVSLDRSWIDTPFFFHQRLIKTSKEIELLKKYGIREVVIDTRRGVDIDTERELPDTSTPMPVEDTSADEPAVEIRHPTVTSVAFKFMV